MDSLEEKIISVIRSTFDSLRKGDSRLVFANYRDQKLRVSEQELRFLFVEKLTSLLEDEGLYYSIETPTSDTYKFKDCEMPIISKDGRSASFDLTIKDGEKNNVAIIEFKAKSVSEHEIAKDLCKLFNPKEVGKYRFFVNVFEKIENKTEIHFCNKIDNIVKKLSDMNSNISIHVIAESLRNGDTRIYKIIKMEK